jgi:hypothetical protein
VIAGTAGCGASSLSLSVSAGAPASAAAQSALVLSNGIVLNRVRIVVTKVELELARTADAGVADLEEHEMKLGPLLIDLSGASLDSGKPADVAAASLPAGTYREIKFKIHKPQSTETTDVGVQAMATAGASIIAEGTIDGVNNFTFTTPMEVQQELEGNFVLGPSSNLTLHVDATSWFGGAGSARLDPRDAANASAIENNIKLSFKAFRDDNRDGHED